MNTPEQIELLHNMEKNLFRLERRKRSFVNQAMVATGLKGNLYRYIMDIHRHPGINQDFLAELHSVDKSRVARVVRQLEVQGYINRKPDETDRRYYRLTLTRAGEALYETIRAVLADWGKLVARDIPWAELQTTVNTIEKMIRNFDER